MDINDMTYTGISKLENGDLCFESRGRKPDTSYTGLAKYIDGKW